MSWHPFSFYDLEPSVEGQIKLSWTCPRCGHTQAITLPAVDLICGAEVNCLNVDTCGEKQVHFILQLTLEYGSYKGLTDRPLAVAVAVQQEGS